MASETQDELLKTFLQIAGENGGTVGSAAATPVGANTHGGVAVSQGSTGSTIESVAESVLEGGLGIVPLVTGLMGLFGGGGEEKPQLEKYQMPSAISFESDDSGGALAAADSDQTGAVRLYGDGGGTGAGGASPSSATPQITVNVQAMDAQSFMDYSSQIAQAVRSAMLNLSSINDVVSEL